MSRAISNHLVAFWGADHLARWRESDLRNVDIPFASKQFLINVGMPSGIDWSLRFGECESATQWTLQSHHLFCIGDDNGIPMCIDGLHNGRVIAVESVRGVHTRYVNAGIEEFAECLMYYQQYRLVVRVTSGLDVDRVVANAASKIRSVDASAFQDENNWWPVIVEQMMQGFL